MRSTIALFLTVAFAAGGCSAHREAGTGDVAFRLVWDGGSDLDLVVEDPAGGCIFYGQRTSELGGILDVDCNAGTDRCRTRRRPVDIRKAFLDRFEDRPAILDEVEYVPDIFQYLKIRIDRNL